MNKVTLFIHFVMIAACSDGSGFSGGTTKQEVIPQETMDESSQDEATSSKTSGETSTKDSTPSKPKKEPDLSTNVSPPPPKGVVKGSFTAWTEPQRPAPRQSYVIVIEVKLPNQVKNYTNEDLSGAVDGTDGFHRSIGSPDNWEFYPSGLFKKRFEYYGTTARLFIPVPGAEYLVRDRISIRSTLLKESQSLEIVFGSP